MTSSIVFHSKASKYISDKYNRHCKTEDLGVYRMARSGRIRKLGFVGCCWTFWTAAHKTLAAGNVVVEEQARSGVASVYSIFVFLIMRSF